MIYILTEDKESGFKFYGNLSEILFNTDVCVYNTSYGSKDNNAGNSLFLKQWRK